MRRLLTGIVPVLCLVLLLLVSISLMNQATEDSARFGQNYSSLLIVNAVGLTALAAILGWNLVRLVGQVRRRESGARLTARTAAIFVLLSLTPVLVVYYFSLQVLHRGIDSWFDVRIEDALTDALELSQTSLGLRMREQLRLTESIAAGLSRLGGQGLALPLAEALDSHGAADLTVVDTRGAIIASSSADPSRLIPNKINDSLMLSLNQTHSYVGLDPVDDSGLHVRAIAELVGGSSVSEPRYLVARFPVAERMGELAQSVQQAYGRYRELAYLRGPLKFSFTLTLTLVLALSVLAAAWSGFFSARRMVAPLRSLAAATRAVAEGDYEQRLDRGSDDELGFLVSSFNDMTRRLGTARDETRRSQAQVEDQRRYLEAVLARMSSGVITVDEDHRVVTANRAASQILGIDEGILEGHAIAAVADELPRLMPLTEALDAHLRAEDADWRTEVNMFGPNGRQVLMCRGTALPGHADQPVGHVVVFDDLTALIQAQRNAAWSEVARRLAHEIKNPLTPIQLSAERLRHKYLARMEGDDAALLDRLTRTIVNQVESMKDMVNAFSAYARSPRTQPRALDLNSLVLDVAALYPPHQVLTELDPALPELEADADRLRQLLHNLLKNAQEATPEDSATAIKVRTRYVLDEGPALLELCVEDGGPGIPEALLGSLFEPYVTNKTRGTGLGLAIVKKIAEEHGGMVTASNTRGGGARVTLRLPMDVPEGAAGEAQQQQASS